MSDIVVRYLTDIRQTFDRHLVDIRVSDIVVRYSTDIRHTFDRHLADIRLTIGRYSVDIGSI